MVKAALLLLSTVAAIGLVVFATKTENIEQQLEQSPQKGPAIVVPENFIMESKIYSENDDGTLFDTLTKNLIEIINSRIKD